MTEQNFVVAVRIRPLLPKEIVHESQEIDSEFISLGPRKLVQVLSENTIVFVEPLTPDPNDKKTVKKYFHGTRRNKETNYTFDKVFGEEATQRQVFEGTAKALVPGLLEGYNATLFAYGATGCGKTHTITGTRSDPGIIYRTIKELYECIDTKVHDEVFNVIVSYLEVYNEAIKDLLNPENPATLDLREDENRVVVAGLSEHSPRNLEDIMEMLVRGNENRTKAPTEANSVSSRSHAVLLINVRQRSKYVGSSTSFNCATLSIIDLAGSERASVTNNRGERLLEGANINRSLLALGNCINALCSDRNGHIPYRDSKLTRLLKFSLQGNCKVVMIANISPASAHYDETHNTLKYANRAKNIKTTVQRNTSKIDFAVSQYPKIIEDLMNQVSDLESELNILRSQKALESFSDVETDYILAEMNNSYSILRERETAMVALEYQLEANQKKLEFLKSISNRFDLESAKKLIYNQIEEIESELVEWNHEKTELVDAIAQIRTQIKSITNSDMVMNAPPEKRSSLDFSIAQSELILHNSKLHKQNMLLKPRLDELESWNFLLMDQIVTSFIELDRFAGINEAQCLNQLQVMNKTVIDGFLGVSEVELMDIDENSFDSKQAPDMNDYCLDNGQISDFIELLERASKTTPRCSTVYTNYIDSLRPENIPHLTNKNWALFIPNENFMASRTCQRILDDMTFQRRHKENWEKFYPTLFARHVKTPKKQQEESDPDKTPVPAKTDQFKFKDALDLSKLGVVDPLMVASPSRMSPFVRLQNTHAMRNSPVRRATRVHVRRSMIPIFSSQNDDGKQMTRNQRRTTLINQENIQASIPEEKSLTPKSKNQDTDTNTVRRSRRIKNERQMAPLLHQSNNPKRKTK